MDTLSLINETIQQKINPLLAIHKGACEAVSYEEGILIIILHGGCSGCPAAKLTLMNLVIPILQENHPDIKDLLLGQ